MYKQKNVAIPAGCGGACLYSQDSGRQRQVNCEFEASLVDKASPGQLRLHQETLSQKTKVAKPLMCHTTTFLNYFGTKMSELSNVLNSLTDDF